MIGQRNPWASCVCRSTTGTLRAQSGRLSGPRFLRITDIQDGKVDWENTPYCECDPVAESSNALERGDVVFARTGATTGKSFLIRECPPRAVFASYLIRIRPKPQVDSGFLAHFFKTPEYWSQITAHAQGAAQVGVNATTLRSLIVPCPPMEEQRRIAAILDKADALSQKRRLALQKLDSLTQSMFLDMFGDPATNPKNWSLEKLGNLWSEKPIYGTMIPPGDAGAWLSLRVGNIQNGQLDLSDKKFVSLPNGSVHRHSLMDGDLVLARAIASQDHLGKCIVVQTKGEQWAFDSHLMRLRLNHTCILPEYLRVLLQTPGGRSLFLAVTRRSAVQFNVNTGEMNGLRVPLAPITDQRRFVELCKSVSLLAESANRHFTNSVRLFSSLQDRAFRGEL